MQLTFRRNRAQCEHFCANLDVQVVFPEIRLISFHEYSVSD